MDRLLNLYVTIGTLVSVLSLPSSNPDGWNYYRSLRDKNQAVRVRRDYVDSMESDIIRLKADVTRLIASYESLQEKCDSLRSEIAQNNQVQHDQPARWSMKIQCRSEFTWWHEAVGKSLEYLDNFDVHCRHGEFLRQWRMTWGEMSGKKAIRYVCCKYLHEPD